MVENLSPQDLELDHPLETIGNTERPLLVSGSLDGGFDWIRHRVNLVFSRI